MNNYSSILTGPMRSIQPITNSSISQRGTQVWPKANRWVAAATFGLMSVLLPRAAHAQDLLSKPFVAPTVFQAAGPTPDSIRSTVDAFRAVPGLETVNGNNPGPLPSGRREINWDGGNPNVLDTTPPVTPFNQFLNGRGSQFTTPGIGLSQVALSGLAGLFNNLTYEDIFNVFSASRLFTPVGSNITEALFFVPGTNGRDPATVRGFGAVFTDVDQPDGGKSKSRTLIEYFDAGGKRIFASFVPASPGDGSLSFIGIKFNDARIASVQVTTDEAPGVNDDRRNDIAMMDDFIYGEPQPLQ